MFNVGRVLSFIATFATTGLLLYATTTIYALLSRPLWGRGAWLNELDQRVTVEIVLAILTCVVLFVVIRAFLRSQRPASALGLTFAGVLFTVSLSVRSWAYFKGDKFDQHRWTSSAEKPFSMTRTLLRDKVFIGLDTAKIMQQFGPSYSSYDHNGSDQIRFAVEGNWELVLLLNNGKVLSADLRR